MSTVTMSSTSQSPVAAGALATRSADDDVRAIPRMLRSEYIKLSTLRSHRTIFALVIAIGALTSWAVATLVTDEVLFVSDVFVFSTVFTAVLSAVSGMLLFTAEAQHGTLALTLTAQPARWVIAGSKALLAGARGAWLGVFGLTAGYVGAVVGGLDMGDTSSMTATTAYGVLFTTLAALLGLGVGMVVRHGAGAVSGLLVWWLVAENLFTLFLPARIERFLPFIAGNGLLGIVSNHATADSIAVALTRPQNAFVFGSYTVVALMVGTVLLYRRDTN